MLENIIKYYDGEKFIIAVGFDDAIIGVDDKQMRLIYSTKLAIQILCNEGMHYLDSLEHFNYNVINAYVGEKGPIWCIDDFD